MTFAMLIAVAAEQTEDRGAIMLQTLGFPIAAIVVFTLLGLVTLSYRHVANRHPRKADAYARAHSDDVEQIGSGH